MTRSKNSASGRSASAPDDIDPRGADRRTVTRDRLARLGLELIEEVGFDAASPTRIAAGAGVTERTFFRHFPRKEMVLFPDRSELVGMIPDGHAHVIDPFVVFENGLRRTIAWRARERDLWTRRYAVIDADPRLTAFDRSLDAELIEGITLAYLSTGPRTPQQVVEARSVASMLTVGGSYILRFTAAGHAADPLIEDLLRRARAATSAAPTEAPALAVVVVGTDDPATRRRVTDALNTIDWGHDPTKSTTPHPAKGQR